MRSRNFIEGVSVMVLVRYFSETADSLGGVESELLGSFGNHKNSSESWDDLPSSESLKINIFLENYKTLFHS